MRARRPHPAATVGSMPRFTFSRGNALKVAALPLYALGALVSAVVPREPGRWVFGCGSGVGEGALALYREAAAADPSLRLTWLARDERDREQATALGMRSVRASSWRGFWATLRASVVVVTHGFGDVNRFGSTGAYVVQLWHGVPLKKIHLDSPATTRSPILSGLGLVRRFSRAAYVRAAQRIRLFPASSELAAERIRSAFALPAARVVVTGDPRDDVLFDGGAGLRSSAARGRLAELLSEPEFERARILLYAPTWRDGAPDPAVPTTREWAGIADYLARTDSLLVVRPHPLSVGEYAAGIASTPRVHLLAAAAVGDITPLLPAVDVLITDYSSIAFDYALVGGVTVFIAPDVASYGATRGLYEPYEDFSGGTEVVSWTELLGLLDRSDADPRVAARLRRHTDDLLRVHDFRDGHSARRVYAAIRADLAGAPLPLEPAPARSTLTIDRLEVVAVPEPVILVGGPSAALTPATLSLAGTRHVLTAEIGVDGERWWARLPLLSARWGGPPLAPASGLYRLRARDAGGRRLDIDNRAPHGDPVLVEGHALIEFPESTTSLSLRFAAPLRADERGADNQSRLERGYRAWRGVPGDAVFFESYFGRNASCNPRGIDRALATLSPESTRYWSVADASVEVPEGAVAVIEGSAEWWAARASARLIVVNDWLRKRFDAKAHQTVLQTWHGTPLKRIALTRPGFRPRADLAAVRESSRWDILLAQNPFSAAALARAYQFRGPVWQEGYPRDDVLITGDAAATRRRLGIAPGARVVLYAPTWRDDRPSHVDHIDVAAFARGLGPEFVVLVRAHSRSMHPGSDLVGEGVLDVTGYPDISDLFLVAESLVTDYSSVMFDFSVTGKPMFFFAPDLDHYRDELRGFYFDLLADSPGPVVEESHELIELVRAPGSRAEEYAEKYAAWRARFNPRDDGHAGERVVRRLIAEGHLGEPRKIV